MKKKIYCIGNAHLDPAWMWEWQEGSAAAKATIRSALDRMKEFPGFKFVCAGASVYQWIEEYDPQMFKEIQKRVDEGRFIIVGGWHVQPDCNIPSGEGFARQSLYAQRYFYYKFGKTAITGYNVDSFGHNGNIPMILKKSGMKNYVYMRPSPKEMPMTTNTFTWESPDGSSVTAFRIHDSYCMKFTNRKELEEKISGVVNATPVDSPVTALFYGVGNHGGGPTKEHIRLLSEYGNNHPQSIEFSDLNGFFDAIRKQDSYPLPVWKDDLQHHASGCYAAFSPIKTAIRKSEVSLVEGEMISMMARQILGKKYPRDEFEKGWLDVNFIHFHDICGGCCIKSAYGDALDFAGEAKSIATRAINNGIQSLSWAINTDNAAKGTPVVVFNPNPFPVEALIRINLRITSAHDGGDNELKLQHVTSQTVLCGRRTDSMIRVKLPALGYSTYYINRKDAIHGIKYMAPEVRTRVDIWKHLLRFPTEVKYTKNSLEDDFFKVEFDLRTGYIRDIFDKKNNRCVLAKRPYDQFKRGKDGGFFNPSDNFGGVPVVIDESDHDTWSHGMNYFDKVIGFFGNAQAEIVERGPLRSAIRIKSFWGKSTLIQTYSLANDGLIGVNVRLDWHETRKMLKLAYPLNLTQTVAEYEIPFGSIARPTNGEEECGQMWIAVKGKEGGVGMLNDGKYSFSVAGNKMNITAIRSPYFGDHGYGKYASDLTDVTDQGESEFNYALCIYNGNKGEITQKARLFNTRPIVVIENNHIGTLPESMEGLRADKENIIVSAFKRSEDGRGIILRAYETDGVDTDVTIDGKLLPVPLKTYISHSTVNTYFLKDGGEEWENVLITEFAE